MLRLINVSHRYEKSEKWILNNVNFNFDNRKYVLVGSSGVGKSTLINIAGKIMPATSGQVLTDFTLGYIFQSFNLLSDFTLRENIELASKIKNTKPGYEEIAKLTGISQILDKFPNQVSGGQNQRAAITRALAYGANFILADEPTANLDQENAKIIIDLFDLINKELNIGFIISTHDNNWLKIADEALKIENCNLQEL